MNNYRKLFSLQDQVIIVTGGGGHLGKEICRGLAAFGATVLALGRDEAKLNALSGRNQEEVAGRLVCQRCDVSDEAAFAAIVENAVRDYGKIDGLVNNAHAARREKWEEMTKVAWLAGLEGTLNHYFTCTKTVSAYMLKAGKGVILNNASLFSFMAPVPQMYLDLNNQPPVHYAAAKGAILQMTRYLATLWGTRGIRVNAFSPGWFPQKRGPDRPDYMREVTSRIPMARIGLPPDVVGAVVFLMSAASSYVTGQNVVIDGGYSVW